MSQSGKILIRAASPDDALAVARIRVETWRHAYRGLMPADVLRDLSVEKSAEAFRSFIARGVNENRILCGYIDTVLAGFALWNRHSESPDDMAELRALYVLPDRQGAGLGEALVGRCAADMQAAGYAAMAVFTLEANRPAQRFYERLGGIALPYKRSFDIAGVSLPEVGYRISLSDGTGASA